jgi:hypothetical protein
MNQYYKGYKELRTRHLSPRVKTILQAVIVIAFLFGLFILSGIKETI